MCNRKRNLCHTEECATCLNYYLWGTKCTLWCDHKLLEPFLTRGMKIANLDRWAMLLPGVWHHICPHKRKRQHPCRCYLQALHNKHLWNSRWYRYCTHLATIHWNEIPEQVHLVETCHNHYDPSTWVRTHYAHYKNKISFVKNKAHKIHLGVKSTFYLGNDGILKWTISINNIEVCTVVIPIAMTDTLIYEFHNCRGHQGSARTLNTLRRRFWWKGMRTNVKYHISNCIICSKTFLTSHVTLSCI